MRLLGWTGSSVGGTCGLARLTTGQVCFNSPCKGLQVSHFVQTSLLLCGQIISAVAAVCDTTLSSGGVAQVCALVSTPMIAFTDGRHASYNLFYCSCCHRLWMTPPIKSAFG